MTKIIVTAKVTDTEVWEEGFMSLGELFKTIFTSPINFGIRTDDKSFAYLAEVKDLDQFISLMNSEKARYVQKQNGVIEGTVRYYILDKVCQF